MEIAVVARGVTYYRDDIGQGTNNDAEWSALIFGVQIAQQLGETDIVLVGDSALVINQANGLWKCRGPALRKYFDDYAALTAGMGRLRIRKIARAQNLAGIALARKHPRG